MVVLVGQSWDNTFNGRAHHRVLGPEEIDDKGTANGSGDVEQAKKYQKHILTR